MMYETTKPRKISSLSLFMTRISEVCDRAPINLTVVLKTTKTEKMKMKKNKLSKLNILSFFSFFQNFTSQSLQQSLKLLC
jgi:hypothetical protein